MVPEGAGAGAGRRSLGPYVVPGTRVLVEVDDDRSAATVGRVLAGLGDDPGPDEGAPVRVRAEGEAVGPLLARLDDVVVAACADTHAVVHGGAAVLGGVAVVIPGASGSGKSTLTAALGRAGWDLLSDELAPLAGGWVEPYPVAPRLRSASWALLGLDPPPDVHLRWPVPLDVLGCRPAARARLTAVVLLDRGGPPGITSAPRAEALEVLCQSCFNLEAGGVAVWRRLVDAVAVAAAIRVGYGAPAEGADLLTRWADGRDAAG